MTGFIRRHRPTPAMIVALTALVFAGAGTAGATVGARSGQRRATVARHHPAPSDASQDLAAIRSFFNSHKSQLTGAQGPKGATGPQGGIGPQGVKGDAGPTNVWYYRHNFTLGNGIWDWTIPCPAGYYPVGGGMTSTNAADTGPSFNMTVNGDGVYYNSSGVPSGWSAAWTISGLGTSATIGNTFTLICEQPTSVTGP